MREGAWWQGTDRAGRIACCARLSNGWQRASKKALKGDHAQHIHAHCDCEYVIRFDSSTTVAGYDPDKYLEQYYAYGGDINAMRRAQYAKNKDFINAQKRAAYAARKLWEKEKSGIIDYNKAVFAGSHDIKWHLENIEKNFQGGQKSSIYNARGKSCKPNWKAGNWKKSAVPMAVFPVIASVQTSLWQRPAMEI